MGLYIDDLYTIPQVINCVSKHYWKNAGKQVEPICVFAKNK